MGTTFREKMAQLSPEDRAQVEAETKMLHTEYLTLKELRKLREMTQAQLAEAMGIRQSSFAQMEMQGDHLISTVRGIIEAMGGRLTLTVELPDQEPVALDGIGDIHEPQPQT